MEQELKNIRQTAVAELSQAAGLDALNELRVKYLGKKGSLTLSLTLGPSKTEAPFEVTPAVVLKAPAPNRRASVFYADADHNLVRRDPNQQELPGLRDATETTRPQIREAR